MCRLHADKGFCMSKFHIHRLRIQCSYNINILGTPLDGFGCAEIILGTYRHDRFLQEAT